jgi:uncharacterized protein (DUF169 family)
MGRPTCAVLPESINTSRTAVSFGCVGNRVYTGTGDAESYFAIPGEHVAAVERSLATITPDSARPLSARLRRRELRAHWLRSNVTTSARAA